MAYYRRSYGRYRRNWGEYHVNKRNQLSILFAGIDKDIEKIFFNLNNTQLHNLLTIYGRKYGASAEQYARKTYSSWKHGITRLSGQTAERLLELIPPYLTKKARYELAKKLRNNYISKSNEYVSTKPESWKQDVIPVIYELIKQSNNFKLPEELYRRAAWLADGDIDDANKILASIEQEEAQLRTAYIHAEFNRIETFVNHIENTKSVSHKISLPQGDIFVTIEREKETFWERMFGGGNMSQSKGNNELVPREDLEKALAKQQETGNLLGLSFNDLTDEQKVALREKVMHEKLRLDVSQQEAGYRFKNSTLDMQNTINAVGSLEQSTKSDYDVRSTFETASGTTNIHVKKNNNTAIIVVAIVIGIIIFILMRS